jgi:2-keto-4-pentenoate hydratase/2-oxohepta-3-ene-1,7-dioic acid hydratase in catechol pathway
MKIVRFASDRKVRYGLLEGEYIQEMSGGPFGSRVRLTPERYALGDVRLLAPCVPSKIVAVGLNYRSHAREVGSPLPEEPLLFLKPATAVIGPEDGIVHPSASRRVDYEGELGVVIGKESSHLSPQEVPGHVLGYTCFNDVTARDLQASDGQWTRAKGFDTFAPLGPCIETEIDPAGLPVETYLNGQLKQQGSTGDLIFSVNEVVSFITGVMTLLPGDVVATGTPSGIGPMSVGDTVEVRIGPIGARRNRVVAAAV